MSYKALYLKYRPQTFEEVAGQEGIVRTLKNALANDKLAHAYLFAGPRGTGKTTMARLLAKALNCEEGKGKQCNHCSNCQAIADGHHPDVIEIDAASNNGVDQVRELIEKVNYAPIKGKYKVYIIDEVHMMTDAAFNALLKTIEEPPESVIFILCTTEPYKVLPTILSRCQRFDFGKINEEKMLLKLESVMQNENSAFDIKALKIIVKLADGGMRDALSILDQVLAYSGTYLRAEDVLAIYGLASSEEKIDLLLSLKRGDVSRVVGKSEAYLSSGIDIRRLVGELIAFLKDLLIFLKTHAPELMDELNEGEAKKLSELISAEDCNAMIGEFIQTQNDFKNVSDVRSLFELSLLRIATKSDFLPEKKEETKPMKAKDTKEKAPEKTINKEKDEEALDANERIDGAPHFLFEKDRPLHDKKTEQEAPTPEPKIVKEKIEKPLDVSGIAKPHIAINGPTYLLTDEQLLGIMILASKEDRTALINEWQRLLPLKENLEFNALASLLYEGKPYALCKDALILSYRQKTKAEKANIMANQKPLQELVEILLGHKVFVYAIDPAVQTRVQTDFFAKQQLSQLPRKDDIVLKLPI